MSMHYAQNFNVHVRYRNINTYWYCHINWNNRRKINAKYVCQTKMLSWQ